ncbi:RNA polymerase sigma-70 factor [Chitinophaga qingshengii]|uniref:RNA polymerase sigma-70 factor n=1 Tax=Chitinophaga qingshengii TaxID=1569794 RepID=A0ABR7TL69_9BACT|nr:RNA polymerase sigma-70 factor [Chitinophaga qingshengii]MBC9930266.1 RNA polymerase sigma-70 factor [Chitinophaga qingshengii]
MPKSNRDFPDDQGKELWEKMRTGGDQYAFASFYHHYASRLFHFASTLLGAREPAEEVVNDVMLWTWKNRHTLPVVEKVSVYLYTATRNTAYNYLKKNARNSIDPLDDLQSDLLQFSPSPEQLHISSETVKKIEQAINTLPGRCRLVFKLIREDGLKYKEVADILDISIKTVEAQMAIAIKKLHQQLQEMTASPNS